MKMKHIEKLCYVFEMYLRNIVCSICQILGAVLILHLPLDRALRDEASVLKLKFPSKGSWLTLHNLMSANKILEHRQQMQGALLHYRASSRLGIGW
jgi:hypothetical protein